MFPTTKPRRSDSFMEPSNTFTYYEDLYSKRNSDEFDEGPVHNCESESEERPRKKKPFRKSSPDRFFRQFAKPKQRTWSEGLERFGEIKRPSKQRQQQEPSRKLAPSSRKENSRESPSPTSKPPASPTFTPINMLSVFKAPATKMQIPNSAGEELDGLLGPGDANDSDPEPQTMLETEAGGAGGGGGGGRGRPVMLMEPPPSEPDDEGVPNDEEPFLPPNPYLSPSAALRGGDETEGKNEDVEEMAVDAASDGDVEDNKAGLEEDVEEPRSLKLKTPPGPVAKRVLAVKQTKPSKKPGHPLGKRVMPKRGISSSEASTPRQSSRRISQQQNQTASQTPRLRSKIRKAQQIAASNRSKMTARAATLREKAKKKAVSGADKEDYFRSVYGRKPKASKQAASEEEGDRFQEYYKAVYGRKKRAKKEEGEDARASGEEVEYADVVTAAAAKRLERKGEVVEVGDSDIDEEEFVRVD